MAKAWYTCDVVRAGPAGDDENVYIALSNRAGPWGGQDAWRWFVPAKSMKREMLATALSAVATGMPVTAQVESEAAYSRLHRFYIVNDL
jgi:hypothetical protein